MNRKYLFLLILFLGLIAWFTTKKTKTENTSTRFSIHEPPLPSLPILASKPKSKNLPAKDEPAALPDRLPSAEEGAKALDLFVDVTPSLSRQKIEKKSLIPALKAKEISIPPVFFKSLQDGQTIQVKMPLFDGKTQIADIKIQRSKDDPSLYFLNGQILNNPLSTVSLTVTKQLLVGQIQVDGQSLQIQFSGDKNHFLILVDDGRLPKTTDKSLPTSPGGDQPDGDSNLSTTPYQGAASGAPGDVPIRLVVLYTAAAQTAAGGESAVRAEIQNQIANIAQNSMNASVTNVVFTLAHMAATPYVQSADQYLDLKRLSDGDDSFMDNADDLLKAHNASLLFLYTATSSNYCGMAWLPNTSVSQSAKYSYGLAARNCNSRFTVAHELGHNFGADHNEASAGTNSQPYARGYINTNTPMFRDLMAYDTESCKIANCPRVHMYSTADVQYQSRTIGTSTANNARRMREVAPTVSDFSSALKIYPGLAYRPEGSPVTFHFDKPTGTTSIRWYHWNSSTSTWDLISGATEDSIRVVTPSSGFHSYYASISTSTGFMITSQAAISVQASTANFTITSFDSSTLSAASGVSRTLSVGTSIAASNLQFQWQINGRDVAGATSSSFTFSTNVNQNVVGVKVYNSTGVRHASRNMNISPPPVAPTITTQPVNSTRDAGQTANFSVTANGNPAPTYQWRRNGTPISGATATSYSISNVQNSHEGSYTVVVTNSAGSITSTAAVLTVRTAPVISTQPQALTVNPGQTSSFSVNASADPSPTYQWRRNGTNISGATNSTYSITNTQQTHSGNYSVVVTNSLGSVTSGDALLFVNSAPTITSQPLSISRNAGQAANFTVAASGSPTPTYQWRRNGTNITGAVAPNYTISNVQNSHEGSYSVVVSNSLGSVTSSSATLTVSAAPVITTQPQNITRVAGESTTLTVVATGDPAPTYQWRRNGTAVSGATSASYTITNTQPNHAGTYTVVVSNTSGSVTSSSAILSVHVPPVITTHPQNSTLALGQSATFSVVATGTPTPTYQWRRNGTNITGATSSTYSIASVQSSHAGIYSVVVSNAAGSVTSNNATLAINGPPVIATQPQSVTVAAGQTATFNITATGSPSPTFQWRRNGTNIAGATAATYSISNTQPSHAGSYAVVVSNSLGSVTSSAATLAVTSLPVITTQPISLSRNVGQAASFSVVASGNPAPTYQWRKNGVNIANAFSANYSISSVASTDAGNFDVVVSNSQGSVTSLVATLTLNTIPVITMQPQSLTVVAGQTANLSVVAIGTPSPTYQWRRNGTNITGATASILTLANAQTAQAGAYTVVVSNSVGTVTSVNANLTISSAQTLPVFSVQPISLNRSVGDTAIFTGVASGNPTPTYQWFFTPYGQTASQPLPAQTQDTLTLNNVSANSKGSYVLRAINSVGAVNSVAAVLDLIATERGLTVIPYLTTGPIYLERTGGF